MKGTSVAVVGGGPAGMLCAAQFAKHGASVTVFEKASEIESEENSGWNITLGQTAKRAIEAAGLSADFGPAWRSEGIGIHACGKPERWVLGWGKPTPSLRLCTAPQHAIAQHISTETERVYGGRVKVERGWRLVGGAVCRGDLILEGPAGSTVELQFDVVVGADGARSQTRALMVAEDSGVSVREASSSLAVLPVHLSPRGDAAALPALPTPSGQPFRACPPDHTAALTGGSSAYVTPKPGAAPGLATCIVSLMHGRTGGAHPTASLTASAAWFAAPRASAAAAAEELAAALPHFPVVWLEELAAALVAEDRQLRGLRFVTCSKLASGRALIIGDAAHAMSPNLGMGCNLALQDTLVLSDAIDAHPGDPEGLAAAYDSARRRNAHAATRMSELLDATVTYKYHRSVLRAVAGWPVTLTAGVNYVPKSVPLPGWLRPGVNITAALHDHSTDFRHLERGAIAFFARIVAIAACACALAATVAAAVLRALFS